VLAGHLPSALMRLRLQARARGVGVAR
jgi:hypothetical protein